MHLKGLAEWRLQIKRVPTARSKLIMAEQRRPAKAAPPRRAPRQQLLEIYGWLRAYWTRRLR